MKDLYKRLKTMPYLKKSRSKQIKNIRKEDRNIIYHSSRWKKLRLDYIKHHPLCEICLNEGIIKEGIDVHHKDSFLNYNGSASQQKAYDWNNLMTLCKYHHQLLHQNHTQTKGFSFEQFYRQHPEEKP